MVANVYAVRRCGCYCVLIVFLPIVLSMLVEFLIGIWFMNQRQGLLPTRGAMVDTGTSTTPTIATGKVYTRVGRYEILEQVPHDINAFTQGLVMIENTKMDTGSTSNDGTDTHSQNNYKRRMPEHHLYEGTGMYGASQLRQLDIHTGKVLAFHSLDKSYFGEGIAHYRDKDGRLRIVQLTWKGQRAFEYIINSEEIIDRSQKSQNHPNLSIRQIMSWKYQTSTNEGWGITYSPTDHVLYVSDGSNHIHVWNAETRKEVRRIAVTYQHPNTNIDQPSTISLLNELEYDPATNTILANVWREDIILRIDPQTGFVIALYDLQNLLPSRERTWHTDVLNGIALTYDSFIYDNSDEDDSNTISRNEIWVTGKYWPFMYRIRLFDNVCTSADINNKSCYT